MDILHVNYVNLSDNDVDFSDFYVDLSLYVDLSDNFDICLASSAMKNILR